MQYHTLAPTVEFNIQQKCSITPSTDHGVYSIYSSVAVSQSSTDRGIDLIYSSNAVSQPSTGRGV